MAFLRATGKLGVRRIFQQGLNELGMIFELATVMQHGFDEGWFFCVASYGEAWS